MWFRNLQVYRLGKAFELSPDMFDTRMQPGAFGGCSRMEPVAQGWVPPLGRHGQQLVHAANGYLMVCLRKEEKIMPAGVVRQMLEDKVAEVEAAEGREIYRRERMRMKEQIIVDLLPRALTRITDLYAYIDTRNGLLVVDSPSPARAELLVSQLRTILGRFPATPLETRHAPASVMTRWLNGEALPPDFVPGAECVLKHPDPDGGVVTCKHQDLGAAEVRNHIRGGKQVIRLAIQWRDRLSCVIQDDLSIKRLRFEDVVREAGADAGADDPVSRFDLDFSLLVLELAEFLPALVHVLGGEALPEGAPAGAQAEATRDREVTAAEPV
ncbi:MAG: recombination-associated protein RdgC [Gammaproteobacteria bacterium]|jgi:recombination associated protein RdgC